MTTPERERTDNGRLPLGQYWSRFRCPYGHSTLKYSQKHKHANRHYGNPPGRKRDEDKSDGPYNCRTCAQHEGRDPYYEEADIIDTRYEPSPLRR